MNRALFLLPSIPLLGLLACAHDTAPPPQAPNPDLTSSVSITSAEVPRYDPPRLLADSPEPIAPAKTMAPMDAWPHRYPGAAVELGQWVKAYPQTADALAKWDEKNAERMKVLVDWAVTWPYESFDAFLMDRAGWDDLSSIQKADPVAFNGYLTWTRTAPDAAREMSAHADALDFADTHPNALAHATRPAAAR